MIIWGSRGREIHVSSGEFYCPRCERTTTYNRKRIAKYFTLYFVPLFQTDNLGEYVECQICGQTYKPEVLDYKPPSAAERLMIAIRDELESGMPLHMLEKKLVASGFPEPDASELVQIATNGDQVVCRRCGFEYLGKIQTCANCGNGLSRFDCSGMNATPGRSIPRKPNPPFKVEELLVKLASESPGDRRSAIRNLSDMQVDDEAVVAALAKAAYGDRDQQIRAEAKAALETPMYRLVLSRGNPFQN